LLRRPEEKNQRVVRASVEREKEKTGMGENGTARKRGEERERGRRKMGARGGARAVDVGTSVSRCEGRNRSLPGSQGG